MSIELIEIAKIKDSNKFKFLPILFYFRWMKEIYGRQLSTNCLDAMTQALCTECDGDIVRKNLMMKFNYLKVSFTIEHQFYLDSLELFISFMLN